MSHTPGPWAWKDAPWGGRKWLVPAAVEPPIGVLEALDWRPILDADPSGGEYSLAIDPQSPDGVLIERAPEILAMLKAMTELVLVLDEANQCRRELTSAWDLIAKAESRK